MQTYTREEQCRLWLQSAPSLSWRTREALLTYFGCAESIFEQMGPTVQMMAGDKAYAELQQMKTAGLDALIDRQALRWSAAWHAALIPRRMKAR